VQSPGGRLGAALLAPLLLLALLACSDSSTAGRATPSPEPPATSSPTAVPTQAVAAPTSEGPPRVTASIQSNCVLSNNEFRLTIAYSVVAEGTARLDRVRVLVDNQVADDLNPPTERDIKRTITIRTTDGGTHSVAVSAESGASRTNAVSAVSCAGPTPGPRL
jgi:hypothetical protein